MFALLNTLFCCTQVSLIKVLSFVYGVGIQVSLTKVVSIVCGMCTQISLTKVLSIVHGMCVQISLTKVLSIVHGMCAQISLTKVFSIVHGMCAQISLTRVFNIVHGMCVQISLTRVFNIVHGMCVQISLSLRDGVGISLVNSLPEELVYITLRNIQVEISSQHSQLTVDASVAEVKVRTWHRFILIFKGDVSFNAVSYTHLRAHET